MSYSILRQIVSVSVLFFGLVSCTETKGPREPEIDRWPEAPKVLLGRPNGAGFLAALDQSSLSLNTRVFLVPKAFTDSIPNQPMAVVPGGVTKAFALSRCIARGKTLEETKNLILKSSWSVAELLPRDLWRPYYSDNSNQLSAECEVYLRLENKYGSTRKHHAFHSPITGTFNPTSDWIVSVTGPLPSQIEYHQASLYSSAETKESTVLACSTFSTHQQGTGKLELQTLLPPIQEVEPSPIQVCRLLALSSEGIDRVTPFFKIVVPSAVLQTQLDVYFHNTDGNILSDHANAYRLRVINPSPYPVQFRARKDGHLFFSMVVGGVDLRPSAGQLYALVASRSYRFLTHISHIDSPSTFETDNYHYFDLTGGGSVDIWYSGGIGYGLGCGTRRDFVGWNIRFPSSAEAPLIERSNFPILAETLDQLEIVQQPEIVPANLQRNSDSTRLPYFQRWEGSAFPPEIFNGTMLTNTDLPCWTF